MLTKFVEEQKAYFNDLNLEINWDDYKWDVSKWIPHRGSDKYLDFRTIKSKLTELQSGKPIPPEYSDFMKSMALYLRRKRNTGFISIRNYVMEMRRLYTIVMAPRKEVSPTQLTRWHFEQAHQYRKEERYKNLYDSAANLKLIADTVDDLKILNSKISFEHGLKQKRSYHKVENLQQIYDDEQRDESKTPSMELFEAYAQCTNNPINDNEEILLRTIDLLIAMGQRGNEVTVIPLDCWVEKEKYDKKGVIVRDANGDPIKNYGIRYFAEKHHEPRIHYLSDQDVPFTRRAITRLEELTKEIREVAAWQEENGKIWPFENDVIDDDSLLKIMCFASPFGLHKYMERKQIETVKEDCNMSRGVNHGGKRYLRRRWYKTNDIEAKLVDAKPDHFDFRVNENGNIKTVLKTSEILSIRFEGAYRFKERGTNLMRIFPHRTTLKEINYALGAVAGYQSIFERRDFTEADGSRMKTTSHSFRHWRNTIYQLTGMTNVQQALALGRKDITQNPYYQHETLREKTEEHRNFVSFNDNIEKINYLRKGIKSGSIKGPLASLYEKIKKEQNSENADEFLSTHASALHVTPFGGCTHDFSQTPCTKHLQCWNGCSNLHRTTESKENDRLESLLKELTKLYDNLGKKTDSNSVWLQDLKTKIDNLKKALDIKPINKPVQVFPDGEQLNLFSTRTSSVK